MKPFKHIFKDSWHLGAPYVQQLPLILQKHGVPVDYTHSINRPLYVGIHKPTWNIKFAIIKVLGH